jgi:hypothetical protein
MENSAIAFLVVAILIAAWLLFRKPENFVGTLDYPTSSQPLYRDYSSRINTYPVSYSPRYAASSQRQWSETSPTPTTYSYTRPYTTTWGQQNVPVSAADLGLPTPA